MSYVTHEAREGFLWEGARIYGPHMKVRNLKAIVDDLAVRPPTGTPPQTPN